MTVSTKWVQQVENVLAEIAPRAKPATTPEFQALQAFQLYDFNAGHPAIEQTPRARAMREITRIATWYGWTGEIARVLDATGALSLAGLEEESLEELLTRMRLLEECVQNGGDAPDAPPAR